MARGTSSWRAAAAGVLAAAAVATAAPAAAGQPCEPLVLTPQQVSLSMTLAQRSQAALDAVGGDVAVIARAGQDLSAHGLHWSHLGFAVREGAGRHWRVVHKLNACGTPSASLYREGLAEFFLTDLHRDEAAVVALSPTVQAALKSVLLDARAPAAVHTPAYNMLAYPWARRYQQSNQWALETLGWAMAGGQWPACLPKDPAGGARGIAQAWLRCEGYRPTTVKLGTMTRAAALATRANVAFDDHPAERRFAGLIDTVTVESVFAFLTDTGHGQPMRRVRTAELPPCCR